MHIVLLRQATGLAGLVLNYSIIAIKDFAANQQGSYPVGDKGPSTVVPAFWYAHQPLTTPPPPSPPPPPPPPPPPKPPCAPSLASARPLPDLSVLSPELRCCSLCAAVVTMHDV